MFVEIGVGGKHVYLHQWHCVLKSSSVETGCEALRHHTDEDRRCELMSGSLCSNLYSLPSFCFLAHMSLLVPASAWWLDKFIERTHFLFLSLGQTVKSGAPPWRGSLVCWLDSGDDDDRSDGVVTHFASSLFSSMGHNKRIEQSLKALFFNPALKRQCLKRVQGNTVSTTGVLQECFCPKNLEMTIITKQSGREESDSDPSFWRLTQIVFDRFLTINKPVLMGVAGQFEQDPMALLFRVPFWDSGIWGLKCLVIRNWLCLLHVSLLLQLPPLLQKT